MLSDSERIWIREAIYVAGIDASDSLKSALAQLNAMVIDGTYAEWTNKQVIDEAIGRSPGYQAAWDSLLRELKSAPPIGGEVFTPEPPASDVESLRGLLRQLGIFCEGGKTGFGGAPVQDTDAQVTVHGGQIVGKTPGNHQNPVEHENVLDICNSDGGIRFLQYGRYFNGQRIRNTTNREMTVVALCDSMGNFCINDTSTEPGQAFYIVKDVANKRIVLATYKPGWTIEVKQTSTGAPYASMDVPKL